MSQTIPSSADLPATPKLGVIVNPHSGRNRSGTRKLDALLAAHPEIPVQRPETPEHTASALAALATQSVNVLAICGGDGTVQQVLNVLLEPGSPFAAVPPLVVLPGGTTNMIAHDLNEGSRPATVLQTVLDHLGNCSLATRLCQRPVMRLTGADASKPAYGLFFGAAGVHEATMDNRGSIDAMGVRDGFGPGLRVAAIILKFATGRDPFTPVSMNLSVDGGDIGRRSCIAILASTMDKLALGMVPFWGSGPGRIRLTMACEGSRSKLRAIWLALRSKAHPLLTPENGYDSLNADRVELSFEGDCVLDGETFRVSAPRPVLLENAGALHFLRG